MLVFPYIPCEERKNGDLRIVTFADGTDEEIEAMVIAANNGIINLSDYWGVGHERTYHINSFSNDEQMIGYNYPVSSSSASFAFPNPIQEMDIKCILTNKGYSGAGNANINFVVEMILVINEYILSAKINKTDTNIGGWGSSKLRQVLNSELYNALPESLKHIAKTITVYYNSTTVEDKISLYSIREYFDGTSNYATGNEANSSNLKILDYYVTTSNHTKNIKSGLNNSTNLFWTRSAFYTQDSSYGKFLYKSYTSTQYNPATSFYPITPFLCI